MASIRSLEELEELLALGHERRDFEVKGPGDVNDKAYSSNVARAVMAMGNLRYGGVVCLGIDNKRISEMQPGLATAQVAQWTDFDAVNTALARYADPPASIQLKAYRLSSRVDVVVVQVDEFQDVPHLCRKAYPGILQQGAMYVRPRGMPKSAPVPDVRGMRGVLEIATDKALREFLRRAGEAGLPLPGTSSAIDSDTSRFDSERAWPGPPARRSPNTSPRSGTATLPFVQGRTTHTGLPPASSSHSSSSKPCDFVAGRCPTATTGSRFGGMARGSVRTSSRRLCHTWRHGGNARAGNSFTGERSQPTCVMQPSSSRSTIGLPAR